MTQPTSTEVRGRVTRQMLLLAGWHNIWDGQKGSRWVHQKFDIQLKFDDAASILKKRGIGEDGDMA